MPTSADGILTCTFDPERLAVQIQVDGAAWPPGSDVQRVTIMRSSAGQGAIPVRDLERRAAAGGTLLWVDNEAPADTDVTYTCVGYDSLGNEVPVGPTNLFTNPSFETNTTGVQASSVTVSRTDTLPDLVLSGLWLMGMTVSASPSAFTAVGQDFDGPAVAGRWYAARMPFRPSAVTGTRRTRVRILFYDAADVQIGSFYSAYYEAPATAWTYPEVAAQAPAGTVRAAAFHYIHSGASDVPTAGDVWRTDAWIGASAVTEAEALTAVASYFDGDSPGAQWSGTPHASTSFQPVATEVMVSTRGAAAGLWVKIPGRADMATRVGLQDAGTLSRSTLGGAWQVPGGVAIAQSAAASLAQSAGLGSLSTTLQVLTRDAGQTAALWQIIGQAPGQVVLLQTVPQPEEVPSGYYQVQNPSQGTLPVSPGLYGKRPFALPVTESVMPAGSGTGLFGATHDDIAQSFTSHTEIAATVSSHLELAEGGWS